MTLDDLVLLQTLFELKNVTKTAEALYLAQPTVSKRLRLLEQEFGTSIVHRNKHGVEFTKDGEYLAVKAAQINGIMEQMRQYVLQSRQSPTKKLRIGASNASIHAGFLDLTQAFQLLYPDVEIELVNEKTTPLVRLLDQGRLDFAFVTGDFPFSGQRIHCRRDRAYIGSITALEPEQLVDHPYVDYAIDPASKTIIEKWWADHYTQPFPTGIHVSGPEVARDLVLRGLGYAFFCRADYLQDHPGYVWPLTNRDGSDVTRDSWCIYHQERVESNSAALMFASYLKAHGL